MAARPVIALLMNDAGLADYYQGGLRRGVEQICSEQDLDLWVYGAQLDCTPSGHAQRHLFELVAPPRIRGIVLAAGCIATLVPVEEVLEALRRRCQVPICAVGQVCAGVPSIVVDNIGGAARSAEHLIRTHKRRRIAYIAGPPEHQESNQRAEGTRRALTDNGLELRLFEHGNFTANSGREIVRRWISAGQAFDAIIAANDDMAVGAIEALRSHGLRCPDAVSVLGFDDAATARICEPSLTTVRQPVPRLGAEAVMQLLALWKGVSPPAVSTIETQVVVRESCGCKPAHPTFGPPSSDAPDSVQGRIEEVARLLCSMFHSDRRRQHWAIELGRAVQSERRGEIDSVLASFRAMLAEIPHPHVPIHELQGVVTLLRRRAMEEGPCQVLEDAFHTVRLLLSAQALRRAEDRDLHNSWVMREVQLSSERLGTALSLAALKQALIEELPRMGIRNALLSLYPPGDFDQLEPFVCLQDGVAAEIPAEPYAAELLIAPSALDLQKRCSLTILPLTFESEQLGVIVLELPSGVGLYALLREQIGSALKTVQLHQEILKKELLHERAQQEKRATVERLNSVGLIAGGVAHDLNNVLGPLLALPSAIQHDLEINFGPGLPRSVLDDLQTILISGERAAHMIRDLLALGRVNDAPETDLDLNLVLDAERQTLSSICQGHPRIALQIQTWHRPLVVRASRVHLARAIHNLLIHAVDDLAGAGKIDIRVLERQLSQRLDGIESIDPGHYAVIEVEDSGAGMPAQSLPQIFEPFFAARRDPAARGTGLGLAIVHRIVKDSLGYVRVQSELGKGTTFSLFFPVQSEAAKPQPLKPPRCASLTPGHERVLVVDDELMQLRTARRVLRQLGYDVETCQSAEDAISMLARASERQVFDLVIVDMLMPGRLNGIATIEEMQRLRPEQKFLIASGYAPEQMDAIAKSRGLAWLPKPYSVSALSAAVRSVLESGVLDSLTLELVAGAS